MAEFTDTELHVPPNTFMGAPYTLDLTGTKAAVLGVPFDCGTHVFRIGSRQGPDAIRQQSALVRPYDPEFADFSPVERLGLVDRGNVRLTPGRIVDAFERIEAAARRIHDAGVIPVTMGGDGSISLPLMRAAANRYPGMVALHFDSHTDAYGYTEGEKWSSATQFTHAAEEQCIIPSLSYHVGMRGSTYRQNAFGQPRALGYNIISFAELSRRGFADVLAELHDKLKRRPVYLCFDMDVLDPSCAPGVCTPIWGGLLAREAIELMRGLAGLNIIAIDVNTVSPPHDLNGMTAFLAAHIIYEGLLLLCQPERPQSSGLRR